MGIEALMAVLEVTAYTAGYESTGKQPWDPGYGITYSGVRAQQGRTVAAGPDIPLGTKLFIPALADWPNGGLFTVEDRGGAISNAHLDIYLEDCSQARRWGRQHLEVLFWLPGADVSGIARAIDRDRTTWRDRAALEAWQTKKISLF